MPVILVIGVVAIATAYDWAVGAAFLALVGLVGYAIAPDTLPGRVLGWTAVVALVTAVSGALGAS
jgi:hypothetical protein